MALSTRRASLLIDIFGLISVFNFNLATNSFSSLLNLSSLYFSSFAIFNASIIYLSRIFFSTVRLSELSPALIMFFRDLDWFVRIFWNPIAIF